MIENLCFELARFVSVSTAGSISRWAERVSEEFVIRRCRRQRQQRQQSEDTQDLAVLAERKGEPTIPHDVLIAELQADGLIK